ncbi:MAG: oxidoreductase-like protein [Rhodospirillales bacterium]|nr:oxidoreductase-like protein [Rhodospirillales bacterium]
MSNAPESRSAGGIVQIGVAGLGTAGRAFLPAIEAHAGFRLVAVAEPTAEARNDIVAQNGVPGYATLQEMLAHPGLDAVYVGTPTDLHPAHVAEAFAAKKHVLVEKPMAVRLDQAQAMIDGAARAGVVLLVGHSHSYDLPIKRMREIIADGMLGRVRMVNTWNFTDWIYRPRRPDELDWEQGGGVTYRQGSHQFDIIRLLGGGMVRSVKARTFDWDPARRAIGAHTVYLDFEDGAVATAVYSGYGGFASAELCFDVTEWGFLEPPANRKPVRRPGAGSTPADELQAKRARSKNAIPASAPNQPFFGLTLVSCERGDIRQSPQGLYVYGEQGRSEIELPRDRSPRDLVMAEFFDAISGRAPALHDGRWGLANLEVCTAAIESSASGREIFLKHQVPVPA